MKKKKTLISKWCLFCYKYLTAVLDYCSLLAWHGTPFSTEGKPWELWAMWPDYRNECHLNAHLYSLMCCAGQCVHVCVYTKCSCSVVAVLFMSRQWSECFMSARVTQTLHISDNIYVRIVKLWVKDEKEHFECLFMLLLGVVHMLPVLSPEIECLNECFSLALPFTSNSFLV